MYGYALVNLLADMYTSTSHRVRIFTLPSSSTTRYLPCPSQANCTVAPSGTGASRVAQMAMLVGVGASVLGLTSVVPIRILDRRYPAINNAQSFILYSRIFKAAAPEHNTGNIMCAQWVNSDLC